MLRKINGWENIEGQRYGEFQSLEPGWHPCVILSVAEEMSNSGRQGVKFSFDIAGGKFEKYFSKQYKADASKPDRKWRGTYWQMTEDKGVPFFKGIITAIEESNPGYRFDWDETRMKGLKVGIGFRREQYEATDGQLKFAVKPFAFCDMKKVISGELPPPKDKLLNIPSSRPAYDPAGVYMAQAAAPSYPPLETMSSEDELPF